MNRPKVLGGFRVDGSYESGRIVSGLSTMKHKSDKLLSLDRHRGYKQFFISYFEGASRGMKNASEISRSISYSSSCLAYMQCKG